MLGLLILGRDIFWLVGFYVVMVFLVWVVFGLGMVSIFGGVWFLFCFLCLWML
jgi:hypothetical protein